ncbi:Stc1 domain-containing protein [Cryomyces antarcticus]
MAPPRSAYSGGYSHFTANKLKQVQLPEKIRCTSCKKHKPQIQYSNKQMADLRHAIFTRGSGATTKIRCRNCTGTQVTELECVGCDTVKGLDEFSRTHRRNPDNARCKVCMDIQVAIEPGEMHDDGSEEDSEDSNPFERDQDNDDDGYQGSSANVPDKDGWVERLRKGPSTATYGGTSTSGVTSNTRSDWPRPVSRPAASRPTASVAGSSSAWPKIKAAKPAPKSAFESDDDSEHSERDDGSRNDDDEEQEEEEEDNDDDILVW